MNELLKYFLICTAAALVSAVCTVLALKKRNERQLEDFQDSVLKKQRDEVQNIYQTMRAWRHDYHNHIQSVKALLSMGRQAELS